MFYWSNSIVAAISMALGMKQLKPFSRLHLYQHSVYLDFVFATILKVRHCESYHFGSLITYPVTHDQYGHEYIRPLLKLAMIQNGISFLS